MSFTPVSTSWILAGERRRARPWAAGPEKEAEKPEEGVKAELLSPSSSEARMQKPLHKMGLAVGAS